MRALLLLAVTALLAACDPYVGSCSWAVPEAEALVVTAPRKPIAGECKCLRCGAPGTFRLERVGYTLEFWNGDRWYADLYVRARTPDGSKLALSSSEPGFLETAPHVPERDRHGHDYFVRFPEDVGTSPMGLRISVLDAQGQVLGVEDVKVRVETRRVLESERF